jgi:hypothetical protein
VAITLRRDESRERIRRVIARPGQHNLPMDHGFPLSHFLTTEREGYFVVTSMSGGQRKKRGAQKGRLIADSG